MQSTVPIPNDNISQRCLMSIKQRKLQLQAPPPSKIWLRQYYGGCPAVSQWRQYDSEASRKHSQDPRPSHWSLGRRLWVCPSKAAPMEVPLGRTRTLNWGSARVSFLARDGGSDSGVDLLEPGGLMALRLPNDSALFGNWEIPDLDLWAVPDIDNVLDHIHRHLSIHHIEYPPQYPKYKKKCIYVFTWKLW